MTLDIRRIRRHMPAPFLCSKPFVLGRAAVSFPHRPALRAAAGRGQGRLLRQRRPGARARGPRGTTHLACRARPRLFAAACPAVPDGWVGVRGTPGDERPSPDDAERRRAPLRRGDGLLALRPSSTTAIPTRAVRAAGPLPATLPYRTLVPACRASGGAVVGVPAVCRWWPPRVLSMARRGRMRYRGLRVGQGAPRASARPERWGGFRGQDAREGVRASLRGGSEAGGRVRARRVDRRPAKGAQGFSLRPAGPPRVHRLAARGLGRRRGRRGGAPGQPRR